MADERVRITNLPDSGSPERVALELMNHITSYDDAARAAKTKGEILDLYAECLVATLGRRQTKS